MVGPLAIRTGLLVGIAVVLAACAGLVPRPVFPELSFAHLAPLNFEAATLTIVDEYVPPLRRPNVEHEMPLRPNAAAARWAQDRVKVTGTSDRTVRVTIKNAAVTETQLPRTAGLRGALTTDQAQRYDAELEITVAVMSARAGREGFAAASARYSTTVPENITLNDREREYFKLVEQLMKDIDRELERQIRQHMTQFLR